MATTLVIALLLAVFLARLFTPSLDRFFLDWRQILMNGAPPENPFVIINVSPYKMPKTNHQFTSSELVELVKVIKQGEPKSIIIALGPEEIKFDDGYKSLASNLEIPGVYILDHSANKREKKFGLDSYFRNYSRFFELETTTDTRYDQVSRRIIIFYDLNRTQPEFGFQKLPPIVGPFKSPESFSDDFEYMETKQIYMKMWPLDGFTQFSIDKIPLMETDKKIIKGKVVLLSADDIWSMSNTASMLYRTRLFESAQMKGLVTWDAHLAANYLTNLISGDYVKTPSLTTSILWSTLWLSLFFYVIIFTPVHRAFWLSTALLVMFIFSSLILFKINSTLYDMGRIIVTTLIAQYFILTFRLISYVRTADANKIKKDNELKMQKMKNSILIRSAQADLSLRVAAQVSHDIRSPLMALQIVSSIIKNQISDEAKELLVNSTDRIKHISNDLLEKYRGEKENTEDEQTDLNEAIDDITTSFEALHKQIKIEKDVASNVVIGMPYYSFQRCLSNILTNAAEALQSTTDPKIKISASTQNSWHTIVISDNGPGIASEIRPLLFKEKATYGKSGGTGIGLNQVKNELEDFGGRISILDSNQGAKFQVQLPADLIEIPMKVSKHLLIVDGHGDLKINFDASSDFKVHSYATISEAQGFLSINKDLIAEITLVTDLFFTDQDQSSLDLLEKHQGFFKIIICSPYVENQNIQELATTYSALLVTRNLIKRMRFQKSALPSGSNQSQ